jgi:hypothetical protein
MKPNRKWIKDWEIGIDESRENDISAKLLVHFENFWIDQKIDDKSKSTKNRYSGALHSLGGYIVEQSLEDEDKHKTAEELLFEYIGPYDGPLIHHDNEDSQNEIDMVSRKFYKYMKTLLPNHSCGPPDVRR